MEIPKADAISAVEPVPGLFISDMTVPRSLDLLRRHGISHVLSLIQTQDLPIITEDSGIQQLHIEIEDIPFEDLLLALDGICAWIENALGSSDDRQTGVLVHCRQGISRSGAVIVGYLMREKGIDYDTALQLAKKSRAIIVPNSGFSDQLRLWHQLGYTIYEPAAEDGGAGEQVTKKEYEDWRANRGVLMPKAEQEKQQALKRSMADMAAQFREKKKLELKEKNEAKG